MMLLILFIYSFTLIQNCLGEACTQPDDCNLICPFGYIRDLNQDCTCECAQDPCQGQICHSDETCISTGSRAYCVPRTQQQRSECPRLTGGICALRCERDSDCQGRLICCSNGCGRECVVPMSSFAIRADPSPAFLPVTPITPVVDPLRRIISVVKSLPDRLNQIFPYPVPGSSGFGSRPEIADAQFPNRAAILVDRKPKLGQCPLHTNELNCRESTATCSYDSDCPLYQKCCTSNCGSRCFDPIKASTCIHFALAVQRLPEKHLLNGYVPTCEPNGKFSSIQCTSTECWCVDVNFGSELAGTRESIGMRKPDMCLNPRQCYKKCDGSHCPHGLLLDESGCPVDGCLCHEVCHGVKCKNTGDSCQLVEPDCMTPPCLPVPRCLINACPLGNPMALSTGVTALCAGDEQCSDGFWCQQIGYNGLGFCCMGEKPIMKEEKCPAKQPTKEGNCLSNCKVDDDCPHGKCCFDGCGLSCLATKFKPVAIRPMSRLKGRYQPGDIAKHNKDRLSSLVADCPELPSLDNCTMECKSDADCPGMRRCCRAGCGSRCSYFSKTTPCFHTALTAEVYSLRTSRKCDIAGNFEHKQCDDNHCYCVDIFTGDEIPGTRTDGLHPNCDIVKRCEPIECQINCMYGFDRDSDGCRTCKCRNPCSDVKCLQGSVCVMSAVDCYQKENCPPQPRCVLNLCPIGAAALSPIGVTETCSVDSQCPKDYWCHNTGISSGGLCCPLPTRPIRPGVCPLYQPLLETKRDCHLECRADDDCPMEQKCCFDGCGTACLEVVVPSTLTPAEATTEIDKPGNCPNFDVRQCSFKEKNNECTKDSHCVGVQKCCSDGCRKVCVYPEKNTACLLLKGAYQQIGLMNYVKCRPDGSFEEIQCNADYCWCVDQLGVELEGTRTSDDISPSCNGRKCQIPLCVNTMDCKFGLKKDSNGCNTCECRSPCDGVACPNSAVCIPMQAECDEAHCIEVPRCVVNPCAISSPLLDPSSFEPIQCKDSNQCIGSKSASYCQVFTHDTGFCCPGPEPRSHPGTCPAITVPTGDCARHCVLDEQCPSDHKCCSNGCGLTCQPAEFATSVHNTARIGECLKVPTIGAFCSQRAQRADCAADNQCLPYYKCCFDGCSSRCTPPTITTQCIHAHLAALALRQTNPITFVPECDSTGGYLQIQQHYGLRWCVDVSGDEIPGTKTTKQPNCRYPRSCPVRSCTRSCPFGFKTDNDGCVVCDCRDPCELIDCPAGSVCRAVVHSCLTENCHPVARCVPNTCPSGEPLLLEDHQVMAECTFTNPCPAGYFCKYSGYMGKGYCCLSPEEPQSGLRCPPVPVMNSSIDGSPCATTCRYHSDCPQATCCFNGCGTSCQFETNVVLPSISTFKKIRPPSRTAAITPVNAQVDTVVETARPRIQAIPSTTLATITIPLRTVIQKVGVCPSTLLNPGCREECLADEDCPSFYKCCKASCAARCIAPAVTTACIHKLLFYYKEHPQLPPPVQCDDGGSFRIHQCDIKTKQCWCVDKTNGKEVIGTRRSSELPLIDCSKPIPCQASCNEIEPMCPFGLRLDSIGCPYSGVCSCFNPCESIQCSSPLARCTLVKMPCLGAACPPVPRCIPNLCGLAQMLLDEYGNPKSCQVDGNCPTGRCVVEEYSDGERVGVCCQEEDFDLSPKKQQLITNCTLMRLAIDRLYNNGAITSLLKPRCADITGHYTTTQCDPSGTCWCVDSFSGVEIEGTRNGNSVNTNRNICANPRICSNSCNAAMCPFGMKLDRFGCPSQDCRCLSPCDHIKCSKGRICVLRATICKADNCLPVPVCELSPCPGGASPALEPATRRPFGCDLETSSCPTTFSCLIPKNGKHGFCCPSMEPFNTPVKPTKPRKESVCPHGDPFAGTSDGAPYTCTATGNGCPSTHYCITEAGKRKGICCVAKRYVCNLKQDRGPCSLSVPRFYYSTLNKTCSPFDYGGCSGNLNNFATRDDCEDFCAGVGLDLTQPLMDADMEPAAETIQLGFSLTGPQLTRDRQADVQKSLLDVFAKDLKIPEFSLSNIQIKDDNSIRFMVTHPEAREFSRRVSDAVSTGRLAFEIDRFKYTVEPHTWFAHQLMEPTGGPTTGMVVLWAALLAAAVCAGLIALCSCVACVYHYRSETKDHDSLRGSTPSNFVSNSIVAHRVQPRVRREMVFSREDLHQQEEEHYRRVERRPRIERRQTPASIRSFQIERPRSSVYY